MQYLTTHENLKLPIIYSMFPKFFAKAIQMEVAKIAHLKVPPNAKITGGEVTLSLEKPRPRPFSNTTPIGYELAIYSMFGLLNYMYQNYAMETNPRLFLMSNCKNKSELLAAFDGSATIFAEMVGMKRYENDAIDTSKVLLQKLIVKNRVFQLGHFGIKVKIDNWNYYQLIQVK